MADNKYGRLFTLSDVEKILEFAKEEGDELDPATFIDLMDGEDIRFKFPVDEPLFVLRGRDKRAFGAVVWYRDHQSKTAPPNHLDGVESAVKEFDNFRDNNPEKMKEPD